MACGGSRAEQGIRPSAVIKAVNINFNKPHYELH